MQKARSAPAIQAKMNTLSPAQLQFNEKLDRLKSSWLLSLPGKMEI